MLEEEGTGWSENDDAVRLGGSCDGRIEGELGQVLYVLPALSPPLQY